MSVFLLVLAGAVCLLFALRWASSRKATDDRRQSSVGKGASRRARSGRFDLNNPLSSNNLNLQDNEAVDPLLATAVLSEAEGAPVAVLPEPAEIKAPSDLIVLHVMAKPGKPYQGYDLLQALLANGLRFGDRKIFHRYEANSGSKNPLYSVTSLNKPGTFDLPKMGSFSCNGLIFFMELKYLADPVGSFQMMFEAAEKIVVALDGYLADKNRSLLSTDSIAQMREQAVFYQRSNRTVMLDS